MIEQLYPTAPKIELFARGAPVPGWDAWGEDCAIEPRREVDLLTAQGQNAADAIRSIGVSEVTYNRWRQ